MISSFEVVKIENESQHEPHKQNQQQNTQQNTQQQIATWGSVISVILLLVISFQLSTLNKTFVSLGAPTAGAAAQPQPTAAAPDVPDAPTVPLDMKALLDDDAFLGDKNAPVAMIEWSDYECPFCGRFYSETLGQIKEKYVKTGKVKFVYRDFPLSFHPQAQKAAEAAECAGGQGKYYEMHDKLFTQGVQGGVASFKQYAKDLGLDAAKFDRCLDSGQMAAEIQKDTADGSAAGIRGTPGFVINGRSISGAQPFQVFDQAIQAALQGQ